jgi:hypothetical protein
MTCGDARRPHTARTRANDEEIDVKRHRSTFRRETAPNAS